MIKEYFANYFLHNCDVTFDMSSGDLLTEYSFFVLFSAMEGDFQVYTGYLTQTGGRLLG